MTGNKEKKCLELMRKLVSDVQGAPYPGEEDVKEELYRIWYEHAQRSAEDCFQFMDSNFPSEQKQISKSIENLLK
ncbi:MAG: hypothetical protein LKF96_10885 [Treponema sp.]|jgi:hypothetical protein|nr:hypothetical protein [Treponema sp.]